MTKNVLLPNKILKPGRLLWHCYAGDCGGCGFYRIILPSLLLLNNHYKGFSFMPSYNQQFIGDLNFYKTKVFLILQRSAEKNHLEFIKQVKKSIPHLKLVYEIDDVLFPEYIPKWNKAYDYYEKRQEYTKKIIRMVDGVTVSTKPLKGILSKYNKNVNVNPNHLPKFLWGETQQPIPIKGKPRILWAGSDNHFQIKRNSIKGGDFDDTLLSFIKSTIDDYQWVFVGGMPIELDDVSHKIERHGWRTMLEYPSFMKTLKINVGIAPLSKHIFNDCKSNIKAKEYTNLGIPGVYSSQYPYKDLKNSCETESFMIHKIETLCNDEQERQITFDHDLNVLKDELYFEENNNIIKYIDNILRLFHHQLP